MHHIFNITTEVDLPNQDEIFALIQSCANQVLADEGVDFDAQIDVTIVDAATIQEVNAQTRDKNAVTDVLSFPMYSFYNGQAQEDLEAEPDTDCVLLGDMLLCYDRAVEQATEFGHSVARECGFLTTHSVLHLLGYDHETTPEDCKIMRTKEEASLTALGLVRA